MTMKRSIQTPRYEVFIFKLFLSGIDKREAKRARNKIVWGAGMAQLRDPSPPGSIPGPGVICGLSLLLILVLAPRGFFSRFSGFPLSSKTNISKFQFDLESVPN